MKFKREEKIYKILEKFGMKKEQKYNPVLGYWSGYQIDGVTRLEEEISSLQEKVNELIRHLGVEYYKKEIKETNGKERNYIKKGFRKIKINKTKK